MIKTKTQLSAGLALLLSLNPAFAGPIAPIGGMGMQLEAYQIRTKQPVSSNSDKQLIGVHLNYDHDLGGDRYMRWHLFRTVNVTRAKSDDKQGMAINLNKDQQHEFSTGVDYQASLAISDSTSINPRAGFEYRRFFHGQDASGYDAYPNQKAHFALLPVGVDLMASLSANWMLEASATYQYLIYSNQVAYTSGNSLVLPTSQDIKANGFGTRFGSDLFYLMGHSRLGIGAFIQSWRVSTDDPQAKNLPLSSLAFMPNNQASQLGVHVSFHL